MQCLLYCNLLGFIVLYFFPQVCIVYVLYLLPLSLQGLCTVDYYGVLPTSINPRICSWDARDHEPWPWPFVTMRPSHVSCSHVSGEAEWPGDWSLYRLPAVTLHQECHDRYYGNNWHKSGCQRGGEVTNFFCQLLPIFSRNTNWCENPMLMTITNKKRWDQPLGFKL